MRISLAGFPLAVLARPMVVSAVLIVLALASAPAAASAAPGTSISEAIAAANPGDTVVIPAGTYHEQVTIDKAITLAGEGMPVIDGGHKGDVVVVTAEGVTIRGFVIQNTDTEVSDEPTGIRLKANGATIENNRLQDVLYGITMQESGGHSVRYNTLSSIRSFPAERRGHAIYMYYSWDNVIEHNNIDYVKDGLFIGFGTRTRLEYNHVEHARYGIHYMYADGNSFTGNVFKNNLAGGLLMFSRDITFSNNEFAEHRSSASGYGLLFKDVDNVSMVDNLIHHNRLGLTMEGAPHEPGSFVTLKHNLIGFNQVAIEMTTTTAVTFTENTFIGNLDSVQAKGEFASQKNAWALDGRGNYWDDYQGYDADGNGIGDIEYRYEGAYDQLVQDNEALRAYSYTPARTALDMAARWFPVYRPDPRVIDPNPLMSPTLSLPAGHTPGGQLLVVGVTLVLVVVPLLVFRGATTSRRKQWLAC